MTIPKQVRQALGARPGDTLLYEVEGTLVRLRRAEPFDKAFHAALSSTLDEWTSEEDEQAFHDL